MNQRQFSKLLLMYKNIKHFLHPHLKHIVLNVLKRGLWGRALTPLNLRLECWVLTRQSSAWKQVWFHFRHSVLTWSRWTMHTKWCKSISSDKCSCFFPPHMPATVFPKLVLCMITMYVNKNALWHYNHLNRCTHELFFYLSYYVFMWLNLGLSPVKLSHVNLILRLARQHRRGEENVFLPDNTQILK